MSDKHISKSLSRALVRRGFCTGTIAYGTNGTSETFAFHPGGANILFGDGSVHFLSDAISIRVYARLVTRKGAEVVNDGDLDL